MSKIMLDIGMASESSNSVTDSLNEALHVLKNAGLVTDWQWVKGRGRELEGRPGRVRSDDGFNRTANP